MTAEIAVPMFDYKNHLGIDRRHGYLPALRSPMARRTTAASSDSCSPGTTPQGAVWADVACRSAANVALLARRGLVPQFSV